MTDVFFMSYWPELGHTTTSRPITGGKKIELP